MEFSKLLILTIHLKCISEIGFSISLQLDATER